MIRLFFALLSFALLSCGAKGTKETGNMPEIKKQPIASAVPDFNADSAYAYVANQVAFGPRVPNTAAHKACGAPRPMGSGAWKDRDRGPNRDGCPNARIVKHVYYSPDQTSL